MAPEVDGTTDTVVAGSDGATDRDSASPAAREAAVLAIGSTLGRYQITGVLGAGGMGRVYRARDPDLNRDLAIKVLRRAPGTQGAGDLEHRLLREAQAMARLNHPNLATAYDVGTVRGEVFIAFELVDGTTLTAWSRAPHTTGERLAVLLAAGRGLEAAHAAGVIHRDFKPDNVLVGRDGAVKVVDFGLARGLDERIEPAGPVDRDALVAELTATGSILGTPAYMAPEQHQGAVADARADQFGFAVSAWEVLYGGRPFRGDTYGELVTSVCAGQIEPPPATDVPPAIERALRRALAVEPSHRYLDLTALLDALERAVAPPVPVKRRRWLMPVMAAGVPIVGAIAVGLIVTAGGRGGGPEPRATPVTGGGTGTAVGVPDPNGGSGLPIDAGVEPDAGDLPPVQPQITGAISRDQVREVVKANIGAITACYERALVEPSAVGAGGVTIQFDIAGTGHVDSTRIVADSWDGQHGIAACIAATTFQWQFPRPADGKRVTVTYPFTLRRSDAGEAGPASVTNTIELSP